MYSNPMTYFTPAQRLSLRKADALDLLADGTANLDHAADFFARAQALRDRVNAELAEAAR
jgi:hypothetical protein